MYDDRCLICHEELEKCSCGRKTSSSDKLDVKAISLEKHKER